MLHAAAIRSGETKQQSAICCHDTGTTSPASSQLKQSASSTAVRAARPTPYRSASPRPANSLGSGRRINKSTACHRVNETGYHSAGPSTAREPMMTMSTAVGTSGHVMTTATRIAIKIERKVKMMLAVVAPSSNASSPRRHPCRHALQASCRRNQPLK